MDSNRRPRRCELSSDAGQGPRAQVTRIEGQKGRGHHRGRHPQGRPLSSHSVWLSCTYYLYSFGFSKRVPHLQAQCRRCLRADDFHWRSPDPQGQRPWRPLPSPSHWPLGPARSGLSWDQPPRSLLRLVLLGAAPRPPEEPPFSSLPPSSSAPFRIHSLARSPLSSKTTLAPRGPT